MSLKFSSVFSIVFFLAAADRFFSYQSSNSLILSPSVSNLLSNVSIDLMFIIIFLGS